MVKQLILYGFKLWYYLLNLSITRLQLKLRVCRNLQKTFIGISTSASKKNIRMIWGLRSISLIPLTSWSLLSLNKASRAATNGLKRLITQIEVSLSINQCVGQAFRIFKGGRFSASWAFSKTDGFMELKWKIFHVERRSVNWNKVIIFL